MGVIFFPVSVAFILLAGYILLYLSTGGGQRLFPLPEKAVLSFGAGMGAVTAQLLMYGLFKVPLYRGFLAAPWVLLAIIVFSLRKKGVFRAVSGTEKPDTGVMPLAARGMLAILSVQVTSVFFRAVSKPIESYDAIVNFAVKSKIMFAAGYAASSPSVFQGIGKGHQDYPLLIPMVQTWVYSFLGNHNDVVVKAVYPLVLAAFVTAVYYGLKSMIGARCALFFAFLLGTMPQMVNFATIGYADLSFSFFVTISFLLLLRYSASGDSTLLPVSALFLGAGMLTKNEGISFFLSSVMVCVMIVMRSEARAVRVKTILSRFFLPLVLLLLPWLVFKNGPGAQNTDLDLSRMTLNRFLDNLGYTPFILNKFQQELFQPKKWNIFWIMVTGFSVLRHKRLGDPGVSLALFFLLANMAVYFAAYMALTGKDMFFHVNTTLSRFMIHFAGIALIYLALLIKDDLGRIGFFREEAQG